MKYAMLGRIIREGGLLTAVMARYSVIPNHCECEVSPRHELPPEIVISCHGYVCSLRNELLDIPCFGYLVPSVVPISCIPWAFHGRPRRT